MQHIVQMMVQSVMAGTNIVLSILRDQALTGLATIVSLFSILHSYIKCQWHPQGRQVPQALSFM